VPPPRIEQLKAAEQCAQGIRQNTSYGFSEASLLGTIYHRSSSCSMLDIMMVCIVLYNRVFRVEFENLTAAAIFKLGDDTAMHHHCFV
jgi:hypothetical protein